MRPGSAEEKINMSDDSTPLNRRPDDENEIVDLVHFRDADQCL